MTIPPHPRARLGRASGRAGLALGAISLGAVLCFRFPAELTTPALRAVYPIALLRLLLRGLLVAALAAGAFDVLARRTLRGAGAFGVLLAVLATLLGGADVGVHAPVASSRYLGLDWFLVDLIVMAALFAPLERLFGRRPGASPREGRRTDLVYFLVGHLLVQLVAFLAVAPAELLFAWARVSGPGRAVAAQPLPFQLAEIIVVADTTQYGWHRLAHRAPLLWRIHSVHHSAARMDWLAGSRLHLLDVILTRAVVFAPLFVLGFARDALAAYLVLVSFHAVFIHADIGVRFGAIERVLVTPRYHHFHHSADAEAVDTNFALHLPLLDRWFGTQRLPPGDAWPCAYGIAGAPLPRGYFAQLAHPFRRPAHVRNRHAMTKPEVVRFPIQ